MDEGKWAELFDGSHQPTINQVNKFINNSLWDTFNEYLTKAYTTSPELFYSVCSAKRGWNIKFKKNGRALCTLYPEEGFFTALVVIGGKNEQKVEALLPLLTDYVRSLYFNTTSLGKMGKWLMIGVTDESILNDVKTLIDLKAKAK